MSQYFNNFEAASLGTSPPAGFTPSWATANSEWGVVDEDSDRSVYLTCTVENTHRALAWDGGDGPGSVAGDVSVLTLVRLGGDLGNQNGVILRGTNTSTVDGYVCNLFGNGTEINTLGWIAYDDGATADVDSVAIGPFAIGDWLWIEAEIVGTTMNMRVWIDGGSRPGSPQLSKPLGGSPLFTSGYVSLYGSNQDGNKYFGQLGVGTAGDPAPSGPLAVAQLLGQICI